MAGFDAKTEAAVRRLGVVGREARALCGEGAAG